MGQLVFFLELFNTHLTHIQSTHHQDRPLTLFRSLQFQFALGMTTILALVLLLITLFYLHQQEVQQQQTFSMTLQTSSSNISQLHQTAVNYTQNAPRNFENYRRDLSLTYKAFTKDLAVINGLHNQLGDLLENYNPLSFVDTNLWRIAVDYKKICDASIANYKKSIG